MEAHREEARDATGPADDRNQGGGNRQIARVLSIEGRWTQLLRDYAPGRHQVLPDFLHEHKGANNEGWRRARLPAEEERREDSRTEAHH